MFLHLLFRIFPDWRQSHDAQSGPARLRPSLGSDTLRDPPGLSARALRARGRPQQGGEAAEEARDGQISIRARHQGAGARGGLQHGLCGAEEAAADPPAGQEAVQDRDPAARHLLHLIPAPRAGCLGQVEAGGLCVNQPRHMNDFWGLMPQDWRNTLMQTLRHCWTWSWEHRTDFSSWETVYSYCHHRDEKKYGHTQRTCCCILLLKRSCAWS